MSYLFSFLMMSFFFKIYLLFGLGESLLLHSGAILFYGAQPLGTEASVVLAVGLVALPHVGSS